MGDNKFRWQGEVYEKDGRQCLNRSDFPFGCEAKDALPLLEVEGKRLRWVGFTFVEEGPAQGDELLLVEA